MLALIATIPAATAAHVDENRSLIWVTDSAGTIYRYDFTGQGGQVAHVPGHAIGIAGTADMIALASTDGALAALAPEDPSAPPTPIARVAAQFGQLGLSGAARPTAVLVTADPRRRPTRLPIGPAATSLSLIRTADGQVSTRSITGLSGVAVAGKSVYVARNIGIFGTQGQVALVRGSQIVPLASGLPRVGRLGLGEKGRIILAAHPATGRLTRIRPALGAVETVAASALDGTLVEAHGLADGRIAVLTSKGLYLADALADLVAGPVLSAPAAPIFVGSWAELPLDLGPDLTPEEVHFDVPDGYDAGFVSYAFQPDRGAPVPLLVAGGKTGAHDVNLVETASGTVLATARFEIVDHWDDVETGPPGFYATDASLDGGSGWGGGPDTPQNVGTRPHTGTWRSLVLMVDTASARWPANPATMTQNRTDIMNHVSDGFLHNGDSRSARIYYEENSQFRPASGGNPERGLTLSVLNSQIFGPVSLPDDWEDYFHQKLDDDGNVIDARWTSNGSTTQTIISRAIADGVCTTADFGNVDVLILVPFSPDAPGGGGRFVWPHANSKLEFLCGTNAMTDRRQLAQAYAPLDFAGQDGRQMHSTLSHELGHTLGLPDLYSFPEYAQDVDDRLTSGWDMMAGSRDSLPHYSISNKMRMGWIDPAQLKLYNFQGASAALETVTLHAAELADPPAGSVRAIEIRLGDGWNYYVEYRVNQGGQISDTLPTDRRVLITDVTSDDFVAPIARPPILLVHNDIDGDGPVIGTGADFEEKDPGTQMDLKVEVVSTDADKAVVQLSYGSNGKPEPGIRPWSGGASSWQSPDIEVRNDKSIAEPDKYFNVPWAGHDNDLIARVRNSGDLLAKGVVVDFFVTEYSSGDGPWVPLGTDTQDIAPGATVEFRTVWAPPTDEDRHYCVIVRIRLYQDPANPLVVDQNIYNNEARSNYTQFVSASASPSSRVGAAVLLANPFDRSTLVFADVKKTHPLHRVFIDHQWLRVGGKGRKPIRVWDEALYGTPEWSKIADTSERRSPKMLWTVPNRLSISGHAARPFETDCGALTLTGGVGLRVDAGRATVIKPKAVHDRYVAGDVSFRDNEAPVSGGTLLVEMRDGGGKAFTFTTPVSAQGHFAIREFDNPLGAETKSATFHYLGMTSAAPSEIGPLPIQN